MEQYHQIVAAIALSMGLAWASGINLYATLLALGLLSHVGYVTLPPEMAIVGDPLVIGAAVIMYAVEFFADKTPGLDTVWDTVHTFVRIPAGALLAAAALGGEVQPSAQLAAAIVGGGIAAGTHFAKAGTRVLINASPEPFSNWAASFAGDFAVILGVWAALTHPLAFLLALAVFLAALAIVLPRLWSVIRRLFAKVGRLFASPSV